MFPEYRESADLQSGGAWVHIGRYSFRVRRWGTPESMRERKKLSQRLFGPLHQYTEEDDALLLAHWLAEFGVVEWEGVEDEKGNAVPFSKDAAREVFLDESLWLSLNNLIFVECCKFENYLARLVEEGLDELKKP